MSSPPPTPAIESPLPLIGVVRSAYRRTEETPVQARLNPDAEGTPVLDLKPYVGRFDDPGRSVRCGWFDEVELRESVRPTSSSRG